MTYLLQNLNLEDQAAYVADVLVTKSGMSFAPFSQGGAFPFFRPRWVSSFEQAEGFDYLTALLTGWVTLGPGHVLLNAHHGEALWHQFQAWSREAQGGVLQKLDGDPAVYSFRPDKSRTDRVQFLIVPKPKLHVVANTLIRDKDLHYAAR